MIIISHRGYWLHSFEQNTEIAFQRSFNLGVGIELDLRDYRKQVVISHDPPFGNEMSFEDFLKLYVKAPREVQLALNIKADGLQEPIQKLLFKYGVTKYFLFDMSIPDTLGYFQKQMKVFTRLSEIELQGPLYDQSSGLWLDQFYNHWITKEKIARYLKQNKDICIVSPELHHRKYLTEWRDYKTIEKELNIDHLMLCTDYPEEAIQFFKE